MIVWQDRQGSVAIGCIPSGFFGRKALGRLKAAVQDQYDRGLRAVLFDISAVERLGAHGAAVLLEAVVSTPLDFPVGFYGAKPNVRETLSNTTVDRALRLFPNRSAAFKAPEFRRHRLSEVRAVVLSAGRGSRMAPLSDMHPKPMLDLLGTPLLGHILHQLKEAGVRDVVTNPGYLGQQITQYVSRQPVSGLSVFCAPEGTWRGEHWFEAPLGSATTLSRLNREFGAITGETLVICGDAIVSMDFAEMIETHTKSGADVTIAAQKVPDQSLHKYGILDVDDTGRIRCFQEKPAPGTARSNLANIGVYILSPKAIGSISGRDDQDIGGDLFPALLASGWHLQVYDAVDEWADVGCPRDYFATTVRALCGEIETPAPVSARRNGEHLIHAEAHVSAGATLQGPVYVAAGAEVRNGAVLHGPCIIKEDCVVEGGCDVRNSMILPDTRVRKGAIVHNMIACGDWAIDHRFADGTFQTREPIDGVVPKSRQISIELNTQKFPLMNRSSPSKRAG